MTDPHYRHYIPVVNGIELLRSNLLALGPWPFDIVIIDNTEERNVAVLLEDLQVDVLLPSVPLTTAQTMNLIRSEAIRQELDVVGFQHADGEIDAQDLSELYRRAERLNAAGTPWGALFTNYDVCCVFNVTALWTVGEWDWLRFPFYFLDNDYYHRLREVGFPTIETGLPCRHHNGASTTIKLDVVRARVNELTFGASAQLLREKWGRTL